MNPEIRAIPLKVPCFLVRTGDGSVMIDTGDSSDRVHLVAELDRLGVKPDNLKLIILTHGDFDHAGNAAFLREKYGAPIAMHPDDSGMVERGDQGWNRKAKSDRVTLFGKLVIRLSTLLTRPGTFDTFKPDVYIDSNSKCDR